MSRILVVDDEQAICWGFSKLGQKMGHAVDTAASAEEGLKLAANNAPDLLILDVRLPGMDGLTAISYFRQILPKTPIIVITAFGDLDTAVKAVQSGAFEYVLKPFDLSDVRACIERALENITVVSPAVAADSKSEIVGKSTVMQTLFKRIALSAASDANILLHGESGVGKELAARAIHQHSAQREANFVAVNIAALSPNLAESELFGHVDGAFTGASRSREGLLAQANGGTLFLDEVADIPLPLQVKLLRAIEQGEVHPVGADAPIQTSFRIIAATHQDLQDLVRRGEFRHDLYFRICAFEIEIPALRDRDEDITLLASYFASQHKEVAFSLAEETLEELQQRPWHGNVRELRNAIEHACVLARSGIILPEHLPQPQPCFVSPEEETRSNASLLAEASYQRAEELMADDSHAGAIYQQLIEEVEVPLIRNALEHHNHECAPAARALGLHRTTLKKKLDQYKLETTR